MCSPSSSFENGMGRFRFMIICLSSLILNASATQVVLTPPALSQNVASLMPNAVARAPEIFNAIHSAMRQWGASLKHNGMSYFPVTVPANTRLYHGAETATPETGPEWLSFEIEHATVFAKLDVWWPPVNRTSVQGPPDPIRKRNGYVQDYRTVRPLTNLLYLDGQASAKSMMGTLDTQDRVLLKHSNFTNQPGYRDLNRARALCAISPDVEGIIRMEIGFELILCNFTSTVEYLKAHAIEPQEKGLTREDLMWRGEWIRGITDRYKGIAAGRVIVDYSSMVSAFFYPLNLTNPDPEHSDLPRISLEADDDTITDLKRDVLAVFENRENWHQSIDWQGVVDLIVTHYSDLLAYISSPEMGRQDMLIQTKFLLQHFIDFSDLNTTVARRTCATHYLLPEDLLKTPTDHLINQALLTVSEKICDVLFDVRESLMEYEDVPHTIQAKLSIKKLMDWLSWTTWLECGRCGLSEFCLVPIWPFGTKEDHKKPQCVGALFAYFRRGYWNYGG
ncbi:hypothetical protein K3495_g7473 [Podosphaera aphanis]|nr:hypothetical protein K3495_g7473 [Podosphaera aphanis]